MPNQDQHIVDLAAEVCPCIEIKSVKMISCSASFRPFDSSRQQLVLNFNPDRRIEVTATLVILVHFSLNVLSPPASIVEASFELAYSLKNNTKLTSDHYDAFATEYGLLHSWPYWRDFAASALAQMGMACAVPLMLPLFSSGVSISNIPGAIVAPLGEIPK